MSDIRDYPAYRSGVERARRLRQDAIKNIKEAIAAPVIPGDEIREPERNLRQWILDRLTANEDTDLKETHDP